MMVICVCGEEDQVPDDTTLEHKVCKLCKKVGMWMKMEIDEDGGIHLP